MKSGDSSTIATSGQRATLMKSWVGNVMKLSSNEVSIVVTSTLFTTSLSWKVASYRKM